MNERSGVNIVLTQPPCREFLKNVDAGEKKEAKA